MRRFWIGFLVVSVLLSMFVPQLMSQFNYFGDGWIVYAVISTVLPMFAIIMIFLSGRKIPKNFNKRVTAEVMDISQTGTYVNHMPQFLITVSFFTENRQKTFAKTRAVLDHTQVPLVQPGVKLEILYQEDKPENIVLAPPEEEANEQEHADPEYAAFLAKEKEQGRVYKMLSIFTAIVGGIASLIGVRLFFTNSFTALESLLLDIGFPLMIISFINIKRCSKNFTLICGIGAGITLVVTIYVLFDMYVAG